MNITDLMKNKHYDCEFDVTIADLRELGEVITDNMSVGALMEIVEILYEEAT